MKRIIEKTDDGSATLFVPELNEHYHSTKGAHTESQHIFIHMGLKASPAAEPRILEVGFGTGLNAWLTLKEATRESRKVHYTGLELYPLDWNMIAQLGYVSEEETELFRQLHSTPWEKACTVTPYFVLNKQKADLQEWIERAAPQSFDLVYFDAFAPEKQPEMWSQAIFDRLFNLLDEGGILTTYCAKGVVRRMLQAAGFIVERLPGPPEGKREILRARKSISQANEQPIPTV